MRDSRVFLCLGDKDVSVSSKEAALVLTRWLSEHLAGSAMVVGRGALRTALHAY